MQEKNRSRIPEDRLCGLGVKLFAGMRSQGMEPTALALASLIGVSPSATGRWLTGRNRPPKTTLQALALKLALDVDELYALNGVVPTITEALQTSLLAPSVLTRRNEVAARLALLTGGRSPLPDFLADMLAEQLHELCEAYDDMLVESD